MPNSLVHTSPSLYDQSVTLKDSFTLHPRRNKNIIVAERGLEGEISEFLTELGQKGIAHELYESSDLEQMAAFLKEQTMGTQLYIVGTWDVAAAIFEAAIMAGFTEDEIETKIIGKKKRFVYCMKCFDLTEVRVEDKEIECPSCSIMLEVGPFYSKVRKGNIGYPFKPVKN